MKIYISLIFALVFLWSNNAACESWDKTLINAAKNGDLKLVQECLINGARPDYIEITGGGIDKKTANPIASAIEGEHFEVFMKLLEVKPDFILLEKGNVRLLNIAASVDNERFFTELLKAGANPGPVIDSLLFKSKYKHCIQALNYVTPNNYVDQDYYAKDKSDSFGNRLLDKLVIRGRYYPYDEDDLVKIAEKTIERSIKFKSGNKDNFNKTVEKAYEFGLLKLARVMDPEGILNKKNITKAVTLEHQLYEAIDNGNADVVKRLLNQGAKISYVNEEGNKINLLSSAVKGDLNKINVMVPLLLKNGADPNINDVSSISDLHAWELLKQNGFSFEKSREDQLTLIMSALEAKPNVGSIILRDFLEKGFNPNPIEKDTLYPLQFAVVKPYNRFDPVPILLEFGADTKIKGIYGKSALDIVEENRDLIRLFQLFPDRKHPFLKKIGLKRKDSLFPGKWSNHRREFSEIIIVLTPDGGCILAGGVSGITGYWEEKGKDTIEVTLIDPEIRFPDLQKDNAPFLNSCLRSWI